MEEKIIQKIKSGLFGIKNGTKEPKDIIIFLNRLKTINKPMWDELISEYIKIVKEKQKK